MTPPKIDFNSFLISLAASTQINLGLIEDPVQKKKEVNLPMAQQTIDILEILEQKTKGNLTSEEVNLLTNLLYQLRMQYLEAKKGEKK